MTLKKLLIITGSLVVALALVLGIILEVNWQGFRKVSLTDIQNKTLEKRNGEAAITTSTTSTTQLPTPERDEIAILLLGLDARYTTSTARCDAIHLFVVNTKNKTIHITSVPRGTYVHIPGNVAEDQQYISNSCSLVGYDYAIDQIEKMVGHKTDYVVKVDFSKSLGILRAMKLPTTESLQWLRNRHSFLIGDHQRSHNQAVFMKDVAIKKIALFKSPAMLPVAKVLHSYVDTNLDFESFYTLLREFAEAGLDEHPEWIELSMVPNYKTTDYHFDFNNPSSMLTRFPTIPERPPSSTTSTIATTTPRTLASIQNELIRFMKRRLTSKVPLTDIVNKRLWLQIEDDATREDLHFKITERLVRDESDKQKQIDIITSYIQEKEALDLLEWADKGKALMASTTRF